MPNKLWPLLCIVCVVGVVVGQTGNNIFPPLPVTFQNSENGLCKQHSEEYLENLLNLTLWAYEMRDASAKSTVGILRGSIFNMGDFQQCLTARAPFPTQYCLAIITANIPEPKTSRNPYSIHFDPTDSLIDKLYRYEDTSKLPRNEIKMGWCIPASCTASEAETYLNEYFKKLDHSLKNQNVTYTAYVPQIVCTSSNSFRGMDSADILFCMLTTVLVLLVIISTCLDNQEFEKSTKRSFLYKLLMAFSARQNFMDLSKAEGSDEAMSILSGIKTFSVFMIIIDHHIALAVGGASANFDYIEGMYRNILVAYVFHGDLFVDTFFVVSGLLAVYTLLTLYEKKYINPGFIVLMRYLRLTPAYAFVLFFFCSTFNQTGSGPLWNIIIGPEILDCKKNWWINLLYISNYVNSDHMCLLHTWYLPCDFHYFIVAIGLVLLLRKKTKYGLAVGLGLTIISVLIPFFLILIYERPALLRFFPDFLTYTKAHPDFKLTYSKSHARATPYLIGMFAGYSYYKLKGSGRILSIWSTTVMLLISLFLLIACLFTGIVFYDPLYGYNALIAATYGSLHRPVWALGTFGIMYATSFGTFSFLRKCLSWRPWGPLSKLAFGAYLWHFIFQLRTLGVMSSPSVFNFFDLTMIGLGDICWAFILSLGLNLTLEAPVRRILKEIFLPSTSEKHELKIESEHQAANEVNVSNCRTKI